jgi:hypothetical protein
MHDGSICCEAITNYIPRYRTINTAALNTMTLPCNAAKCNFFGTSTLEELVISL